MTSIKKVFDVSLNRKRKTVYEARTTSFENFLQCPRKFKFGDHMITKPNGFQATTLGDMLHAILQDYTERAFKEEVIDPHYMLEFYQKHNIIPSKWIGYLRRTSIIWEKKLHAWRKLHPNAYLVTMEEKCKMLFENDEHDRGLIFTGTPDVIVFDPDTGIYYIWDFKSAKSKYNEKSISSQKLQFRAYPMLLDTHRGLNREHEISFSYIVFPKTGNTGFQWITSEDVEKHYSLDYCYNYMTRLVDRFMLCYIAEDFRANKGYRCNRCDIKGDCPAHKAMTKEKKTPTPTPVLPDSPF